MRFFSSLLFASTITIPRGKSTNEVASIVSKASSLTSDLHQSLDPSFLLFELLREHLSFQDLANLNSVSTNLHKATRPLLDIARLCDAESTYPRLILKSGRLGRDCVEALVNVFRNHGMIKFDYVAAADWRILELGIPLNDLILDHDVFLTGDGDRDGFWNALKGYRGGLSLEKISLIAARDRVLSSLLSSATGISRLKLAVYSILDHQAIIIGSFLKKAQDVSSLSLENLKMSEKAWQHLLEAISQMNSLKKLELKDYSGEGKTEAEIAGTAAILSSVRTLEDFMFSDYFTDQIDFKPLLTEGLRNAKNLKRLEWDASLSGEFSDFGEALKAMKNLEELRLMHGFHSNDAEYQVFMDSLAEIQTLKRLTIDGTYVGRRDQAHIATLTSTLAKLNNLQELELGGIDLILSGKRFFESFVTPTSLKHLFLDFQCPFDDYQWPKDLRLSVLNMILDCQIRSRLETLRFHWDKGAVTLSFASDILQAVGIGGRKKLQTIKHLDLGAIRFESDLLGLKHFAKSISLCKALESLKIRFSDGWESLYSSIVVLISKHVPDSLKRLQINSNLYERNGSGKLVRKAVR